MTNAIKDASIVIVERRLNQVHKILRNTVSHINPARRNAALILGDASLVQSRFLLSDAGFRKVVNVDADHHLLDNEVVSITDSRLLRILSRFDRFDPSQFSFDLIYGKSIAFNPKETIVSVLSGLWQSLSINGIYAGVFALHDDEFRPIEVLYTLKEIKMVHESAGMELYSLNEHAPRQLIGLRGRLATHHIAAVFAQRTCIRSAHSDTEK